MDIWGDTKIDFMGKRKITFAISIILVIVGIIAAIAIPLGKANLSTDFEGGIALQFKFDKPLEIDKVRGVLEAGGFQDAELQQFAEPSKLLVKLGRTQGDLRAVSESLGGSFSA